MRSKKSLEPDDVVGLYFQDVGSVPLLAREEEVELARIVEQGEEAEWRLRTADDGLHPEEHAHLQVEVRQGQDAFAKLVQSNARLVISIAKRYTGHGVPLLDLIQEGNLGLIRAAEKFDYRKGYKFSTYATWWIRQAVQRTLADQGRTIRLPVHIENRVRYLNRLTHEMELESGRQPTPEEVTEATGLSLRQVELTLNAAREPLSLDKPVDDEGERELRDLIEGEDVPDPSEEVDLALLSQEVEDLLSTLPLREARILRMRYGLKDGYAHTLKEIGEKFGLTRERIRQIEQQALKRLRHPQRSRRLRAYLN